MPNRDFNINRLISEPMDLESEVFFYYKEKIQSGLSLSFKGVNSSISIKNALGLSRRKGYSSETSESSLRFMINFVGCYRRYLDRPFLFDYHAYQLSIDNLVFIKSSHIDWYEFLSNIKITKDCKILIKELPTDKNNWGRIIESSNFNDPHEHVKKLSNYVAASFYHIKPHYLKLITNYLDIDVVPFDDLKFDELGMLSFEQLLIAQGDISWLSAVHYILWDQNFNFRINTPEFTKILKLRQSSLEKFKRKISHGIVIKL